MGTVLPAVTCSAQSTILTGTLPREHGIVANGWYNLGVLALQRGDVGEALQFFHDGLELNSGDKEMERHREIAKRYRGKRLDSTFSTYANGIALREMDD